MTGFAPYYIKRLLNGTIATQMGNRLHAFDAACLEKMPV
jgi:hypothetical protein